MLLLKANHQTAACIFARLSSNVSSKETRWLQTGSWVFRVEVCVDGIGNTRMSKTHRVRMFLQGDHHVAIKWVAILDERLTASARKAWPPVFPVATRCADRKNASISELRSGGCDTALSRDPDKNLKLQVPVSRTVPCVRGLQFQGVPVLTRHPAPALPCRR